MVAEDAGEDSPGVFFDQRAYEAQRRALQAIFAGQASGWPAQFAELVGDMRGVEFAPIQFGAADDLSWWTARIPGKVEARGAGLAGHTARPAGSGPQPPGAEIGPAGSPPMEWRSPTRPRASGSAGSGRAGSATTSPSTGSAGRVGPGVPGLLHPAAAASSTPQPERARDAWQAERYQRGEIGQRPGYIDNPFRAR